MAPNTGGLTDREAAIDSVIRFVNSLDYGDADLCASSLTADMEMDLTPFRRIGWDSQNTHGRDAVVDTLMKAVGQSLDTTHMATNIRCTVDGDRANLTCCVLAQHFRLGEGVKPECNDCYLFGNQYEARIMRDGEGLWRIGKLTITPAWVQGNPEVMKV